MTQIAVVLLCSLVAFILVEAVDYIFAPSDEPIQPCAGKEKYFFERYFDFSNLESHMVDDDTMVVNGFATFIEDLDPRDPISLKMVVQEYKFGRWVDTGFTMYRDDACETFFKEVEIWHDLVKGLPTDCPPKKGEKYEFHNKSMKLWIKNLAPELQGFYRIVNTFSNSQTFFCFIMEGDIYRL